MVPGRWQRERAQFSSKRPTWHSMKGGAECSLLLRLKHFSTEVPEWLAQTLPHDVVGCIVFGTQTRRRHDLLQRLRSGCTRQILDLRLSAVRPGGVKPFVDLIVKFKAAPEQLERQRLEALFVDGLVQPHGLSGLWPAQYQTTRGLPLDLRMQELLSAFDMDMKRAISTIAFLNYCSHLSKDTRFPNATMGLVRQLIQNLYFDDRATGAAIASVPKVLTRMDGEMSSAEASGDIGQLNNSPLELRHPALADSLFRWCFGAAVTGRGEFLFNKWPYYGAVIRALADEPSDSMARSAYAVLGEMNASARHDYKTNSELTARLKDKEHPKVGDWILSTIGDTETAFGSIFTDGGGLSRRLTMMKSFVLISDGRHGGKAPSSVDRDAAAELLKACLPAAIDEKDDTVLRYAADVAQKIRFTYVPSPPQSGTKDWRGLIERADELESVRSNARPTRAIRTYVRLALDDHDPKQRETLQKILKRAKILESDQWESKRLETLFSILKWFRRDRVGGPQYLLPKRGAKASMSSIQGLYIALWRELRRLDKSDPSFRQLLAFSSTQDATWMALTISGILNRWLVDFEEEDDCWPEGVIDLVEKARDDPRKWLSFIESYDAYYP